MDDVEMDGITMLKGDMVMAPLPLAGFDDTLNDDPDRFDPDRQGARRGRDREDRGRRPHAGRGPGV